MKVRWMMSCLAVALVATLSTASHAQTGDGLPTLYGKTVRVHLNTRTVSIRSYYWTGGGWGVNVQSGRDNLDVAGGKMMLEAHPDPDIGSMIRITNGFLLVGYDTQGAGIRNLGVSVLAIRHCNLVLLGVLTGGDIRSVITTDLYQPPGNIRFIDFESQLELNPITSIGDAPDVATAWNEQNDKLVYDPKPCWALNRQGYERDQEAFHLPGITAERVASIFLGRTTTVRSN